MSDESGLVKIEGSPYRSITDATAVAMRELRAVQSMVDLQTMLRRIQARVESGEGNSATRDEIARALFDLRITRDAIKREATDAEYAANVTLGTCAILAGWFVLRVSSGWVILFALTPIAVIAHLRVRWAKNALVTVECLDGLIGSTEKRLAAAPSSAPLLLEAEAPTSGDPK